MALRILELCGDGDPDAGILADLVTIDPALAVRFLCGASSADPGSGTCSIRDAALRLDAVDLQRKALGFALASEPGQAAAGVHTDLPRLWSEAVARAATCRAIAPAHFKADAEEAYAVGLLADIALIAGSSTGSADLLARWDIPQAITGALRSDHGEQPAAEDDPPLARCLAVARLLTPWFTQKEVAPEELRIIFRTSEEKLGLRPAGWEQLSHRIRTAYEPLGAVIRRQPEADLKPADLLARARELRDALDRGPEAADLADRTRFDARIAELHRTALSDPFAVVLLALDQAADAAELDALLGKIRAALSAGDVFARVAVGRFAIVAAAESRERACLIGARAHRMAADQRSAAGRRAPTLSVGIIHSPDLPKGESPPTAAELIAEADRQLRHAQAAGGDTWSYLGHTPRMRAA